MPFHLNNGFDGLALLLAVLACALRLCDRGHASTVASSFSLLAAMAGQLAHHRRERAEAREAARRLRGA